MTTPEYDPTSGYQPNGGWGYHEWGAAGAEAWANAGQATQNGDPSTAAEWTAIAQQADANSSAVYVGGGAGYGSGGDSSGFNDGTYWGQGAVSDPSAATPSPSYDSAAPTYEAAPSLEAAPSYDTGAATDTAAADPGVSDYAHHDDFPTFDDAGHADLALGF